MSFCLNTDREKLCFTCGRNGDFWKHQRQDQIDYLFSAETFWSIFIHFTEISSHLQYSFLEYTHMCPSPVQSAASPLPPPETDAWCLAALWSLPLVSWWLWAPLASLWVLVLWVFWWVSGPLAFQWAQGLSVSLLWLPSLLLSLPWLQRDGFKREKHSVT